MTEKATPIFRLLLGVAGLVGAIGVMAAATASHGEGSRNLAAIAAIGLAHGPALLALGLAGRGRLLGGAGALLAGGTIVFIADLGVREWLGHGLFPGAAGRHGHDCRVAGGGPDGADRATRAKD